MNALRSNAIIAVARPSSPPPPKRSASSPPTASPLTLARIRAPCRRRAGAGSRPFKPRPRLRLGPAIARRPVGRSTAKRRPSLAAAAAARLFLVVLDGLQPRLALKVAPAPARRHGHSDDGATRLPEADGGAFRRRGRSRPNFAAFETPNARYVRLKWASPFRGYCRAILAPLWLSLFVTACKNCLTSPRRTSALCGWNYETRSGSAYQANG